MRSTQVQNVAPLTLFPMLEKDPALLHAAATQALELIGQVDPAMHGEIDAHLSVIKLFDGPGVEGFSSPKAFGAIWLRVPQPGSELNCFLEHLVHEVSQGCTPCWRSAGRNMQPTPRGRLLLASLQEQAAG